MASIDYIYNNPSLDKMYHYSLVSKARNCVECVFTWKRFSKMCSGCENNIVKYLPMLSDEEVELWLEPYRRRENNGNSLVIFFFGALLLGLVILTLKAKGVI